MKVLLLAAAAFIASPLLAQVTPGDDVPNDKQSDQSTLPSADPDVPVGASDQSAMPAPKRHPRAGAQGRRGKRAQAGRAAGQPMMSGDQSSMAPMASADSGAGDPAGGYQPAGPAMQGQMQPGATVTFQPSASPSQAYPAPAPMASYPVCKAGQFDNCRQRVSPK